MSDATVSFLSGGGEMGKLCRAYDWAKSPLGPVEEWPQSLRSAVSILLPSKAQIILFWGPQFVCIYNDAYRPIFGIGARHPRALGQPGAEAWDVVWPVLGPLLKGVVATGEAFSAPDFAYFVDRGGFLEEVYFDVSYDPVRDETGGVGGVFCIVSETTLRVLGERRLRTLRDLGAEAATVRRSIEDASRSCIPALDANPRDVPFAMVFLAEGDVWSLGAVTSQPQSILEAAGLLDPAAWPLPEVSESRTPRVVSNLTLPALHLEGLPPGCTPSQAVVLPIRTSDLGRAQGVLVMGVSAVLALDEAYQGFFGLVARHLSTAIANATAYLEEKKRAEALAEIDRAKTAFFSNVSHEFRTPLTLMLGPLEDLIARLDGSVPAQDRQLAVMAHRNALRLHKLVNTLLDFSRIEAGRAQASYEPTDLSLLTAELASSFRSVVEKAGMRLVVNCPPLGEPVFVDRQMWEKVVLNLLSNAFKYTFDGEIRVEVARVGDVARLTIADTGVGIPEEAVPHLFERFYRVENASGRTHEGSGIGLALVQELVALHGGSVQASSVVGTGSTFVVSIPLGADHLPKDRIGGSRSLASTAVGAASFVEEALRWLPEPANTGEEVQVSWGDESGGPIRAALKDAVVVLADDNADMRGYVERLLLSRGFKVVSVGDGQAALDAVRRNIPDLVLADVMMPRLDGFGLLAALRADPELRTLPAILLSARAGQESTVEGLAAGATDYIVKPFSARELCARVEGAIQLSRVRRATEALRREADAARLTHERLARRQAEQVNKVKDEFLATLSHELRTPLNAILGWLHLLKKDLGDRERVAEGVTVIERNARAQSQLISDLLDMSRIASGKIELEIRVVHLPSIISAAIEAIRPAADAKGVHVEMIISPGLDVIEADGGRLQQIIGNLLTNAVKFTPRGGRVEVAASKGDATVDITVSDTGEGIAPDLLPYVFDRFWQADASITRAHRGLGLGLAIVKQFTELHGGSIVVDSEGIGRGSTFRLKLPATQTSSNTPSATPAGKEPAIVADRAAPLTAIKVLVVDDDADSRELLQRVLMQHGAEVRGGASAREGYALLTDFVPDVVVSDIGMPGEDGYQFMAGVRSRGVFAPAIALTAYARPEDRTRALSNGYQSHVSKPVEPLELVATVAALSGVDRAPS